MTHTMSNLNRIGKKLRGFTLVELMVVVAIIGILAAMAYPSYLNQIRKTNRKVAMTDLTALAQAVERAYTAQIPYSYKPPAPIVSIDTAGGGGIDAVFGRHHSPADRPYANRMYDLSAALLPPGCAGTACIGYTLTATPKAGSTQGADGNITLGYDGTRTWAGNKTNVNSWQE